MRRAPGAGTSAGQGTSAQGFNIFGSITGYVTDANFTVHGFLRSPSGKFTTFDVPNVGTGANLGTFGYSINASAEISGSYTDANGVSHGFVRNASGAITTFDAPNPGTAGGQGTLAAPFYGLNLLGASASTVIDNNGVSHGYVLAPNAAVLTFNVPGQGSSANQGTFVANVNLVGGVSGSYVDANYVSHGSCAAGLASSSRSTRRARTPSLSAPAPTSPA